MFIIRPGKSGSGSRNNRGVRICEPEGRVTGIRVCEMVEARFTRYRKSKCYHAESAKGKSRRERKGKNTQSQQRWQILDVFAY